jgi:hypothetical protein
MWTALHGDPAVLPLRERNVARMLFGDGPGRSYVRPMVSSQGTDPFLQSIVSDLKSSREKYPRDPSLLGLVKDLQTSDSFRQHWQRAESATLRSDSKTVEHPEVGSVTLDCDVLLVPGVDLRMVTYTAAAGTSDSGKLDLLRVTRGGTELSSSAAAVRA